MTRYSNIFASFIALLASGLIGQPIAFADTIAIIGTGEVAAALGPEFAAQGHQIIYGSRDPSRESVTNLVQQTGNGASAMTPAESVIDADMVVMAVPGELVDTITRSLGDLSGKVIIDPTNALGRDDEGLFTITVDTSNGEIIQAAAPGAYVVKAFNTLNWRTMVDPETSGGPVSIPLVGDNDEAKARVAALVEGMGLEAIDLGPLQFSRHVEGMLILWINSRFAGAGEAFDYHLRKTP